MIKVTIPVYKCCSNDVKEVDNKLLSCDNYFISVTKPYCFVCFSTFYPLWSAVWR